MPPGDIIRRVRAAAAQPLHQTQNVPGPVHDDGSDVDRSMWYGYSDQRVVRVHTKPPIDRPIGVLPTNEREPESAPPPIPISINTNNPPWVSPPFWAVPVSLPLSVCVPWYEVATTLGTITVPQDYQLVIKEISYQALNAVLFDTFQLDFLVNNQNMLTIEDMLIDTVAVNPAKQYALSGHFRPVPTHLVADRNGTLTVRGTLRGAIDFAGVSPKFPGQPITSVDCQMKVLLHGWLANLRENLDGGPRPTDLGDFGNMPFEDDQSRGGFP